MANNKANPYKPVDASPVKSFFVYMLTRDILLEDAILDLLDNCVDGIIRSKPVKATSLKTPYAGFWAEIKFDKDSFSIADNCGGIPVKLHPYAFRAGRDPNHPVDVAGTIGAYGIGMKRAIFKMGKECLISSRNGNDSYEVDIPSGWMDDEKDWNFPVKPAKQPMKHEGTTLVVGDLQSSIASRFSVDAKAFKSGLEQMVETHYASIIQKGFKVTINNDVVKPRPVRLLYTPPKRGGAKATKAVEPFIFKTTTDDGVEVFLAVGFTRPIPSTEELDQEQEGKRYSAEEAGWTIICNDRAVVYCNKTELTGWGEAGVPRFHNQFIAISGIVEFRGDASKLPTTTTKRDVDASSALYLQIKNKMREGMRIFTDYTNRWKSHLDESRKYIEAATPLSLQEIKIESARLSFRTTTRSVPPGKQFKPDLPMPKKLEPRNRRISFVKNVDEVRRVADHLFDESDTDPSVVGEKCFDLMLKESR